MISGLGISSTVQAHWTLYGKGIDLQYKRDTNENRDRISDFTVFLIQILLVLDEMALIYGESYILNIIIICLQILATLRSGD